MKKKREELLQDVVSDYLWMSENQLGTGLIGHHGYMGSVVVWKINDNGSCDYMDFCEFYLQELALHIRQYGFKVWQNGEYLYFEDTMT